MLPSPMGVVYLHDSTGEVLPADDDNNYSEATMDRLIYHAKATDDDSGDVQ